MPNGIKNGFIEISDTKRTMRNDRENERERDEKNLVPSSLTAYLRPQVACQIASAAISKHKYQ